MKPKFLLLFAYDICAKKGDIMDDLRIEKTYHVCDIIQFQKSLAKGQTIRIEKYLIKSKDEQLLLCDTSRSNKPIYAMNRDVFFFTFLHNVPISATMINKTHNKKKGYKP